MKKSINILFLILFISSAFSYAQNSAVIAAGTNYNLPVGSLSDRLKGNFGGWFYAGKQVNDNWTWVGKFEYFRLNEVNEEQMYKIVETNIGGTNEQIKFPLNNITMELTVVGLTAEAKYKIFKEDFVETNLNLGFGFYYWNYDRSGFSDSLFADTTGNGDLALVEILDVPPLNQKDWSGGINLGLDFDIYLFEPLWLNISANYKLIIAELWPTLSLNLENVSGLQFIDIRAGLKVNL